MKPLKIYSSKTRLSATQEPSESKGGAIMKVYTSFRSGRASNKSSEVEYSEREVDILQQLSFGLTADRIAKELFISPNTVKTHIRNMLRKSESINSIQMIAKAIRDSVIY